MTRSYTNWTLRQYKMAKGLNFWIWKGEELYDLCSENKGAYQLHVNVQLICTFVFAYAKMKYSLNASHMSTMIDSITSSDLFILGVDQSLLVCLKS